MVTLIGFKRLHEIHIMEIANVFKRFQVYDGVLKRLYKASQTLFFEGFKRLKQTFLASLSIRRHKNV